MTDAARQPWDRRAGETARAHEAFRTYRDLGPLRSLAQLSDVAHLRTLQNWAQRHDWRDRAAAWDDELHRAADARRLEAIRDMHDIHSRAGRAVLTKALRALERVEASEIPPYVAGRLLELGARLERETLTVSVEDMQGIEPGALEDPWEIVARELEHVDEPAE